MVPKSGAAKLELEISGGESNRLEFKKELPKDHRKYLKTIVAFSNGSGGKLLFGVSDDRSVVGIPDDMLFSTVDSITLRRTQSQHYTYDRYSAVKSESAN